MNQIIEVKIIKRKVNYIATSSLFPQCKGIGKTKKEAMSKLSGSISSFIQKMVGSTLNDVFSSNNYTQVMLDQTENTHEETLAFNLSGSQSQLPRTFLLKVAAFTEEDSEDIDDQGNEDEVTEYFDRQTIQDPYSEEASLSNDLFEQLTLQQKSSQDPDAIVFGFPLNFN